MTAGRPAKFKRSAFGDKLFAARQQMGLSQTQLADKLGITQSTYAGWERRTTALKPEYISSLAEALHVSVDYLLGHENGGQRKGGGPVGKARRIFEEVSQLPRHKQQRILGIVEDLLAAQRLAR
jgi:transcriptional regulator with XRE-family HTH domain